MLIYTFNFLDSTSAPYARNLTSTRNFLSIVYIFLKYINKKFFGLFVDLDCEFICELLYVYRFIPIMFSLFEKYPMNNIF